MFYELLTITNIYKIKVVKSRKVEALTNTDTIINTNTIAGANTNIKSKKKRPVYKTLETWYKYFNHFNIKNIF